MFDFEIPTVEQNKFKHGTFTSIFLGHLSQENAERVAEKIEGKSYMNFHVCIAPMPGGPCVTVETQYDNTPEKILGMLLFVMASEM